MKYNTLQARYNNKGRLVQLYMNCVLDVFKMSRVHSQYQPQFVSVHHTKYRIYGIYHQRGY